MYEKRRRLHIMQGSIVICCVFHTENTEICRMRVCKCVSNTFMYRIDINLTNPLKTKRNLLYIKTRCVPRSKHSTAVIKNE
jgi:hypothetical protein